MVALAKHLLFCKIVSNYVPCPVIYKNASFVAGKRWQWKRTPYQDEEVGAVWAGTDQKEFAR